MELGFASLYHVEQLEFFVANLCNLSLHGANLCNMRFLCANLANLGIWSANLCNLSIFEVAICQLSIWKAGAYQPCVTIGSVSTCQPCNPGSILGGSNSFFQRTLFSLCFCRCLFLFPYCHPYDNQNELWIQEAVRLAPVHNKRSFLVPSWITRDTVQELAFVLGAIFIGFKVLRFGVFTHISFILG